MKISNTQWRSVLLQNISNLLGRRMFSADVKKNEYWSYRENDKMGVYEKDKVIYDEKINDWITFMDVISLDFSCLSAFYLKFVFEVLSWVWWWKKNALGEIEMEK